MTTLEMEIAIMRHFDVRKNLIVPGISWGGDVWFETDILSITKSGYATAVEIKVSAADLRKDKKKAHIIALNNKSKDRIKRMYGNIKSFYYAVPENLKDLALSEIPDEAGLLVVRPTPKEFYVKGWIVTEVKSPKTLFKTKWTDKMIYQTARLGAIRVLGLKVKINNLLKSKKR